MTEINQGVINSLLPDDDDEDLLGGAAAKKERDIIESNRVKLANYIHDVTTLFPLLRQEGIFSRDDVEIIEAPVTTTAKVDKCLDVLLRKGPRAIGVFHEALSYHYRHLFNYLAQLFTQAGLTLPSNRQMKDEEVELKEADPLDIRRSRSYSTYRNGSRSVTIRKRLEVMSRQCEMMEKEKDGLQRALGDREHEISSLLSTKEHVQTSLNNVQSKYMELLLQLADWRALLESDTAVKQWTVERESIQQEYDQMEQEYNLQCSELNAARERISLLLQQLERSEKIVSITQETGQKEKDILKHKLAVQEGEIQRLLSKLDYVITTPPSDDASGSGESPEIRCEKLQRDLERANDQMSTLTARLEVLQKERTQAYDERDESTRKLYYENEKRRAVEKENKKLKAQLDSISNCSDPLNSPQTPQKVYTSIGSSWVPSQTLPMRHTSVPGDNSASRSSGVKVETMEVFMPAPRVDADLGMKLELGVVVKELKDGSLPHKHGVRIGDEICQVNKFSLYGERPLEFFNRLLYSATQPVTLLLRRQLPVAEQGRQYATLPPQLPLAASSLTNRPISPIFPSPLPFPNSSTIFPLNPQLGAATLSRKSPAFQEPTTVGSPVNITTLDAALDSKASPRPIGRVSTDGTNSTHSTNKEFFSSSSSDEDGERSHKKGPRTPVIIPQQKYSHNRLSGGSEQIGIVGSPTDKTASVWRDNRLTRISTIDSGFEFPFNESENFHDVNMEILRSEDWEFVDNDAVGEEVQGEGDVEGEGGHGAEEIGGVHFRKRRRAVRNERSYSGGPRRQNGVYKGKGHISKSLDDLNEMHNKPAPVRRQSRSGERTVAITKEVFSSEIKLIGGRGYGIFIETDSRRHTVETGDRILEVGDKCVQGLTRAEVVELLDTCFSGKDGAVRLTVLYDAKALSQLPHDAKDNFFVRCTQCYRPTHSLLSKNNEMAFEKGDVLHITNTLPAGHTGFWQAQKQGSKGETLAVGLVPITFCPEMADEGSPYLPQIFRSPKSSPKCCKASSLEDHRSLLSKALHIYRPVRRVSEVQDPRPVVLLGVLQKDFRKHLVNNCHTGTPDNVKFCFPTREDTDKLEKCADDEIVERLQVDGKTMLTTITHIKEMAREGYHCVLSCDAEGLILPGLQNLLPIVLKLHTTAVRVVNKIRQRLPQDGEFSAQEEIDYADSLKRYRQYFTGQIDLQGTMSDVVKDIKTTVTRQQKSVIWENDS